MVTNFIRETDVSTIVVSRMSFGYGYVLLYLRLALKLKYLRRSQSKKNLRLFFSQLHVIASCIVVKYLVILVIIVP